MPLQEIHETYRSAAQDRLTAAIAHLRQGGKATRARCVRLVGEVFAPAPDDAALSRFAEAIELLHLGTLIHDDILDGADLRRGRPAVHVAYGAKVAVLAGDVAVSRSGRMIAEFDRTRLSRRFAETLAELCEGELLQDEQLWNAEVTLPAYLDRMAKKTAGLFELACEGAAVLAGASDEAADRAGRFGRDLGCLFQMVDDLLDGTGDSATLGKPSGQDLDAGCLTLKAVVALHDREAGPGLRTHLAGPPPRDTEALRRLLTDARISDRASEILEAMIRMTLDALAALPRTPARDQLDALVDQLGQTGRAALAERAAR